MLYLLLSAFGNLRLIPHNERSFWFMLFRKLLVLTLPCGLMVFATAVRAQSLNLANLGQVLNDTNLVFTTPSYPPGVLSWTGETNVTHDGVAAARSTGTVFQQDSIIQTTITGPGALSFWWQLSAPPGNLLYITVGNNTAASLSTSNGWQSQTVYLGAGSQTVQWVFEPIIFPGNTSYVGLLDQVNFTAGITAPATILIAPTNVVASAGTSNYFSGSAQGTPPYSYQWQLNGTNITDATNATYAISDVQAADQGNYTFVVTNAYGPPASASATLTVTPASPFILTQPQDLEMITNGYADFRVTVQGTEPFAYQWYHNSALIPGATNSNLHFVNVQAADEGTYQVTVNNSAGSISSSTATFTLQPSVVVGWGDNSSGPIPKGLTNVVAIGVGDATCTALRSDGTVVAWGNNFQGQTNVPPGLTNVTAIAVGESHTMALLSNGTVVCWGGSESPDGDTNVPAGLTNVVAIAVTSYTSLALKSDGTLVGWGGNYFGELTLPAGVNDLQSIVGGVTYYVGVRSNGTVIAWGANPTPEWVAVPAGLNNVVSVTAGDGNSMALKGDRGIAELGDYIVPVPAAAANTVAIACGVEYLGLQTDGTIIDWSAYTNGIAVPIGLTNAIAVTGDYYGDYFAILNNGTPVLTYQPLSQTVLTGSNTLMSVGVAGNPPLLYQWSFNGAAVSGATNYSYTITNTAFAGAGNYQCVVSNTLGQVTSRLAKLTVQRSTPMFSAAPPQMPVNQNGFPIQLSGLSGHGNIIIYFSTNLHNWTPILTNAPVVGSLQITDRHATNFPAGFYRAVEQ
jgi:hypothetical protein